MDHLHTRDLLIRIEKFIGDKILEAIKIKVFFGDYQTFCSIKEEILKYRPSAVLTDIEVINIMIDAMKRKKDNHPIKFSQLIFIQLYRFNKGS